MSNIDQKKENPTFIFAHIVSPHPPFVFGSNAYGVKREMLLSDGGSDPRAFNMAWDTKWICQAKIHENHYILEWSIPLSAFKYSEGETKWRFNTYQFDTQDNVIIT